MPPGCRPRGPWWAAAAAPGGDVRGPATARLLEGACCGLCNDWPRSCHSPIGPVNTNIVHNSRLNCEIRTSTGVRRRGSAYIGGIVKTHAAPPRSPHPPAGGSGPATRPSATRGPAARRSSAAGSRARGPGPFGRRARARGWGRATAVARPACHGVQRSSTARDRPGPDSPTPRLSNRHQPTECRQSLAELRERRHGPTVRPRDCKPWAGEDEVDRAFANDLVRGCGRRRPGRSGSRESRSETTVQTSGGLNQAQRPTAHGWDRPHRRDTWPGAAGVRRIDRASARSLDAQSFSGVLTHPGVKAGSGTLGSTVKAQARGSIHARGVRS